MTSNSTSGPELVVLHTAPSMLFVKFLVYDLRQCTQTKDIQYWFIEGQTRYLGIPRGAKMYLALNEPKLVALHSNSNSTSENAPQMERNY